MTESCFHEIFRRDPRDSSVVYAELCAALDNHKRSHQWLVKQMVPRLDNWLRSGLYASRLPEHVAGPNGHGVASVAAHNRRMVEINLANRRRS